MIDLGIIGSRDDNDSGVHGAHSHALADLEPIDVGQPHVGHQYISLKAPSGLQRISAGRTDLLTDVDRP